VGWRWEREEEDRLAASWATRPKPGRRRELSLLFYFLNFPKPIFKCI
jgi:hypothetical protein